VLSGRDEDGRLAPEKEVMRILGVQGQRLGAGSGATQTDQDQGANSIMKIETKAASAHVSSTVAW